MRPCARIFFPGDGLEVVAFLAWGRSAGRDRHRLVVRHVHPVPHEHCRRARDQITWQADDIEPLLDQAEVENLSLGKVHSHPQGFSRFSAVDDASDWELLPTIRSWIEADIPHGSAIMLSDGGIFGRFLWHESGFQEFTLINVVGPTLRFWWAEGDRAPCEHEMAPPRIRPSETEQPGNCNGSASQL